MDDENPFEQIMQRAISGVRSRRSEGARNLAAARAKLAIATREANFKVATQERKARQAMERRACPNSPISS